MPSGSWSGPGAVPGQLDQRAELVRRVAGDRARREEVAGAQRRAVAGQVGELLGGRPVERGVRRPGDQLAVEPHLERADPVPGPAGRRYASGARVLRGRATPGRLQRRQRDDPRRDRGQERLAQKRPERPGLERLDVARAPVVDQHHAENVLAQRAVGTGRPRPVGAPTTKPTSASMSSRSLGPNTGPDRSGAVRAAARPACRRPRPCRTGRGSRPAGASRPAAVAAASGPEDPADVRRVLLGGVEVDVVGHRRTAAPAVRSWRSSSSGSTARRTAGRSAGR